MLTIRLVYVFDKSEIYVCLSPFSIPNPNYRSTNPFICATKDTWSQTINIPCRKCPQCIAVRQMEYVQRIQMESLWNHLFFTTLTYSNEMLPIYITSNGSISYVDWQDFNLMCKRIRNGNLFGRDFRYVAVSERGGLKHRPHIHVLWLIPKEDGDDFNTCLNLEKVIYDVVLSNWCRNYSLNHRKPDYHPICEYHSRWYQGKFCTNYDTHYVNPSLTTNGVSDCAYYVLKYMMKPNPWERSLKSVLMSMYGADYYKVFDVVKSCMHSSQKIGYPNFEILQYLRYCIERSDFSLGYPQYFSPSDGSSFPLARYYRNIPLVYDFSDAIRFSYEFEEPDLVSSDKKLFEFNKFEKMLNRVNEHETQVFYDLV